MRYLRVCTLKRDESFNAHVAMTFVNLFDMLTDKNVNNLCCLESYG